jgi:hypothetical protein
MRPGATAPAHHTVAIALELDPVPVNPRGFTQVIDHGHLGGPPACHDQYRPGNLHGVARGRLSAGLQGRSRWRARCVLGAFLPCTSRRSVCGLRRSGSFQLAFGRTLMPRINPAMCTLASARVCLRQTTGGRAAQRRE